MGQLADEVSVFTGGIEMQGRVAASRPVRGNGWGGRRRNGTFIWSVVAVLCVSVALVSYRYLLDLGPPLEIIASNLRARPWLMIHVTFAATALLVAPFQFLPGIRARRPQLHRRLGRIYAIACLAGGVSGFVLALGASTGLISTAGFGALAVYWVVTTALAWRHARRRMFAQHRAWMIRSFALTFAAVTLRLYLPIALALPFPFENSYRVISFLCWVPNALLAEWYLRRVVGATRHGRMRDVS